MSSRVAPFFSPLANTCFPSPSLLHSSANLVFCSTADNREPLTDNRQPLVEGRHVYLEIDDSSRRSGRGIGRRRAARGGARRQHPERREHAADYIRLRGGTGQL